MHPGQNWHANSLFVMQMPSSGAVPGGDLCGVWISEKTFVQKKRDILQYHEDQNSLMGDEGKLVKVNFILKEKRNAQ